MNKLHLMLKNISGKNSHDVVLSVCVLKMVESRCAFKDMESEWSFFFTQLTQLVILSTIFTVFFSSKAKPPIKCVALFQCINLKIA